MSAVTTMPLLILSLCPSLPFSSPSDSALWLSRLPFITSLSCRLPPLHRNGTLSAPPRQPRRPCPPLPCPPRAPRHQALQTPPRCVRFLSRTHPRSSPFQSMSSTAWLTPSTMPWVAPLPPTEGALSRAALSTPHSPPLSPMSSPAPKSPSQPSLFRSSISTEQSHTFKSR